MTANAIPRPDSNIYEVKTEQRTSESCAPVPLKQRFAKLLLEVFEGHEEYPRGDAGLVRPS
jgi:hypothetical protein